MQIGVDTDKRQHALVALDARGQVCGTPTAANTPTGWAAALRWAHDLDTTCIWSIENGGSLGNGLVSTGPEVLRKTSDPGVSSAGSVSG